mmetsp:Transcript_89521/g.252209  ORF Transcript_89521/g.252209 Transcript_89521/m.252209 type:complete len:230 (-) Transcript_89521:1725-2414(-)
MRHGAAVVAHVGSCGTSCASGGCQRSLLSCSVPWLRQEAAAPGRVRRARRARRASSRLATGCRRRWVLSTRLRGAPAEADSGDYIFVGEDERHQRRVLAPCLPSRGRHSCGLERAAVGISYPFLRRRRLARGRPRAGDCRCVFSGAGPPRRRHEARRSRGRREVDGARTDAAAGSARCRGAGWTTEQQAQREGLLDHIRGLRFVAVSPCRIRAACQRLGVVRRAQHLPR